MPDWVTQKHPDYEDRQDRNQKVWDLYSGKALHHARDRAQRIAKEEGLELDDQGRFQPKDFGRRPDLGSYLYRRAQGENPAAFSERARLSKFPPHFSQILDRHIGAVQMAGYKMDRWTDDNGEGPLGDPMERGSVANQLMMDADGQETSWDGLMEKALRYCFLFREVWALVDGRSEGIPRPRVMILDPESVINWRVEDGRLVDVVVTEQVDARDTIRDEHKTVTRYIHYDLDGYRRFDEDGEPIEDDELQPGGERVEYDEPLYETEAQERQVLPVVRTKLMFDRDIPLNIARDQEYLFNELSDIRMMLRLTAHPKLHIDAGDQEYQDTKNALLAGANLIRASNANWLTPSYSEIGAAYEQYKAEVQEMYDTAFQQLENEARQKTATEIQQKDQRGRQAFLVHLSDRADEFENAVRWRLAQLEAPGSPQQWTIPRAERSRDYTPVDPNAEAQFLKDLYFPGDQNPVPASMSTKKQAAMQIADLQGIPEEDEQGLEAAITVGSGRPSDRRVAQLQQRVANAQDGAS